MTKVGGVTPADAVRMPKVADDISVNHVIESANEVLAEDALDSRT